MEARPAPWRNATEARTPTPTVVRWFLTGRELPPLTQALRLGELVRKSAMGASKLLFGPGHIPEALTGHGWTTRFTDHRHAFWLAETPTATRTSTT